jgi:hypothetical protein
VVSVDGIGVSSNDIHQLSGIVPQESIRVMTLFSYFAVSCRTQVSVSRFTPPYENLS